MTTNNALKTKQYEKLIREIAGGSRGGFRDLYLNVSPKLFGVAMRILRDQEKAKDVLQEALMQVWRQAARFDHTKGNAEAWMVGIVRFRAIDAIRRDRARENLVGGSAEDFERGAVQSSAPEAYLTLHNCLQQLGENERRCIFDAHFAGYTHEELSIRHAAPLGTIKSRIRRSLFALKECLDQ